MSLKISHKKQPPFWAAQLNDKPHEILVSWGLVFHF